MKFILGTKEYMTQLFDEKGFVHPVTAIKVLPGMVIALKTKEKDGYLAAVCGFGEQKESRISKPVLGQFKDLGKFRYVKEFRADNNIEAGVGDNLSLESFNEGEKISIAGTSKGKGFQGVVKRHGFHGGRRSHGQKHSEREPGSIGGGGRAGGRVVKGMRMAGRMGQDRVTLPKVTIVKVDRTDNILYVKGPVPGSRGSVIEITA